MNTIIKKDIVIIGGGIAGLWLLNRLCNEGYDAILFEAGSLGQGQTIASQGMIHGGVKYALDGALTNASNTIADMPAYWNSCINGEGDIDLSGTTILSKRYFMWPRASIRSRMTAYLGSKALRGKVEDIPIEEFPEFFKGHIDGPLYQLSDIVLDIPSLMSTLSNKYSSRIFKAAIDTGAIIQNSDVTLKSIEVPDTSGNNIQIDSSFIITTCGEGTEELISQPIFPNVPMQRRPLHMVMLKHQHPDPIFVHCVSGQLSSTPELTLTTHQCNDGKTAWYLGGKIAEEGIELSATQQISKAQQLVSKLFPWCDLSQAEWKSFFINRAEPEQQDGSRPDTAFIKRKKNLMVCWPTKLTLAPALSNQILDELNHLNFKPGIKPHNTDIALPSPEIAKPPWEIYF